MDADSTVVLLLQTLVALSFASFSTLPIKTEYWIFVKKVRNKMY